jgi:hypothetical protein
MQAKLELRPGSHVPQQIQQLAKHVEQYVEQAARRINRNNKNGLQMQFNSSPLKLQIKYDPDFLDRTLNGKINLKKK